MTFLLASDPIRVRCTNCERNAPGIVCPTSDPQDAHPCPRCNGSGVRRVRIDLPASPAPSKGFCVPWSDVEGFLVVFVVVPVLTAGGLSLAVALAWSVA
jgi:hypothetical protein